MLRGMQSKQINKHKPKMQMKPIPLDGVSAATSFRHNAWDVYDDGMYIFLYVDGKKIKHLKYFHRYYLMWRWKETWRMNKKKAHTWQVKQGGEVCHHFKRKAREVSKHQTLKLYKRYLFIHYSLFFNRHYSNLYCQFLLDIYKGHDTLINKFHREISFFFLNTFCVSRVRLWH